jgi:hypothetical protein
MTDSDVALNYTGKGKAVPLHAMEVLGGRGGIIQVQR